VIAYFGKEAFQKLKHGTRKKVLKALEVFNFSDKKGRIFYFRADHDVEGMQKNIEILLNEVSGIIGLDKIKILVFDRGGFCHELFQRLTNKYKIKFITLAVKNPDIMEQIKKVDKKRFKRIKGSKIKKYIHTTLDIGNTQYRTLLVLNEENKEIHPFITNIEAKDLSDDDLLRYYSMHWRQEQEHNAVKKIGGDMHAKAMEDAEYEHTTLIKKKTELRNSHNKIINEIIRYEKKQKRIKGRLGYLKSGIKPISKRTDHKTLRKEIEDCKETLKEIKEKLKELKKKKTKTENQLKRIPDDPKKKKIQARARGL